MCFNRISVTDGLKQKLVALEPVSSIQTKNSLENDKTCAINNALVLRLRCIVLLFSSVLFEGVEFGG